MKIQNTKTHPARSAGRSRQTLWGLFLLTFTGVLPQAGAAAVPRVVLWDSGTPVGEDVKKTDRSGWRMVPTDLMSLEADPQKAGSDPGYYGREYSFSGDPVFENASLMAVFDSARGQVILLPKFSTPANPGESSRETAALPGPTVLTPLSANPGPRRIRQVELVRNVGDEVALNVVFAESPSRDRSATFVFGRSATVEIQPGPGLDAVRLAAPLEYGVVPGFVGDDLIFDARRYSNAGSLSVPAENVIVGLLTGESSEWVLTWPTCDQRLNLVVSGPPGQRRMEAMDFHPDGRSFHLSFVAAPGIWHREPLAPKFLEKDVRTTWKRPFPARWKTQLDEAGVRTTFTFKDAREQIWRGVPGSYNYPAWFEEDHAVYHLSKKVPPVGESVIYFLEGQDSPPWITTPTEIMQATLGRPACTALFDIAGRKLRTHHRRGGDGVRRACTCGCTEVIQDVFKAGTETTHRQEITEALEDMTYFVKCHVERIDEYRTFANNLVAFLQAQASSSPGLKNYLDAMTDIARKIPQEWEVQKENMKSLQFAHDLTRRTLALTSRKDPNNFKSYMALLDEWRAMGGAQDYVLARCHAITRDLFQQAAYAAAELPQAVSTAREIRRRCRDCLRNPDGYEIWANY